MPHFGGKNANTKRNTQNQISSSSQKPIYLPFEISNPLFLTYAAQANPNIVLLFSFKCIIIILFFSQS